MGNLRSKRVNQQWVQGRNPLVKSYPLKIHNTLFVLKRTILSSVSHLWFKARFLYSRTWSWIRNSLLMWPIFFLCFCSGVIDEGNDKCEPNIVWHPLHVTSCRHTSQKNAKKTKIHVWNIKGYLLFFCSIILVSDGQLQSGSFFSFLPLILHLNTIGPRLAWIQLRPFAFWSFHFFHVAICRLKLKSKFHTALPQFDALTNLRCSNSR